MYKTNKKVTKITKGITLALMAGFILPTGLVNAATPDAVNANTVSQMMAQDQHAAKAFADLPEDHWAFDAVQTLADKGVVVGYEDGLFKGQRHATRYEMAQVVARAMANQDKADAQTKQLIHRLSAEFSNELSNLGVRVSALESKIDNVKWNGEVRYDIQNRDETNQRDSAMEFRLEPTAQVNDNFKAVARVTASVDEDNSNMNVKLDRAYAEADYKNMPLNVKLGQVGFEDESGLIFDNDYDSFRGATVKFGNKMQIEAGGGRWEGRNVLGGQYDTEGTAKDVVSQKLDADADYQFVGAQYTDGKVTAGAAFHHLKSADLKNANVAYNRANEDGEEDVWSVNAGYKVTPDLAVKAAYAKNEKATVGDESKSVQVNYKGAKANQKNSWGVFAAYKDLGANTTFSPSGFGVEKLAGEGVKGYQVGGSYTPWQNVVVTGSYFDGQNVLADKTEKDTHSVEGRVSFLF